MKEFKVVRVDSRDMEKKLEDILNDYCNNGWSLVSVHITEDYHIAGWVIFSREV